MLKMKYWKTKPFIIKTIYLMWTLLDKIKKDKIIKQKCTFLDNMYIFLQKLNNSYIHAYKHELI